MANDINIKISKGKFIALLAAMSIYAFADYVSIVDSDAAGGIAIIEPQESASPIGTISMWSTATPPEGWLELNGQSTAGYPDLQSLIGSNVPDLRGQFVRGWDNSRGLDTNRSLASNQAESLNSSGLTFKGDAVSGHTHTRGSMNITGSMSSVFTASSGPFNGGSGALYKSSATPNEVGTGANYSGATGYRSFNLDASRSWSGATSNSGAHTPKGIIEGSGTETRPTNISLMYIIKAE